MPHLLPPPALTRSAQFPGALQCAARAAEGAFTPGPCERTVPTLSELQHWSEQNAKQSQLDPNFWHDFQLSVKELQKDPNVSAAHWAALPARKGPRKPLNCGLLTKAPRRLVLLQIFISYQEYDADADQPARLFITTTQQLEWAKAAYPKSQVVFSDSTHKTNTAFRQLHGLATQEGTLGLPLAWSMSTAPATGGTVQGEQQKAILYLIENFLKVYEAKFREPFAPAAVITDDDNSEKNAWAAVLIKRTYGEVQRQLQAAPTRLTVPPLPDIQHQQNVEPSASLPLAAPSSSPAAAQDAVAAAARRASRSLDAEAALHAADPESVAAADALMARPYPSLRLHGGAVSSQSPAQRHPDQHPDVQASVERVDRAAAAVVGKQGPSERLRERAGGCMTPTRTRLNFASIQELDDDVATGIPVEDAAAGMVWGVPAPKIVIGEPVSPSEPVRGVHASSAPRPPAPGASRAKM